MPKIQFAKLPRAIWQHLVQTVDERTISQTDLLGLQALVATDPVAPDGEWYKDFGSFILCGKGQFPKTVLEKGMRPFGAPVK